MQILNYSIKRAHLVWAISSLLAIFFLVFLSVIIIENPDINNYQELLAACSIFTPCSVEPIFWIISDFVNFTGAGLIGLYSFYISLIFYFVWKSGVHVFGSRSRLCLYFPVIWFFSFGIVHALIQIRFGLACAIALYAIVVSWPKIKSYFFSFIAFLTHFSTGLVFFKTIITGNSIVSLFLFHIISACVLLLLKNNVLGSILPDFIESRLSVYLNERTEVSLFTVLIALFVECSLFGFVIFRRLSPSYIIAATGFLPYLIAPDIEILVRLGVPFQYFLLLLFVKDFSHRFIYLFPIALFFVYKISAAVMYIFSIL